MKDYLEEWRIQYWVKTGIYENALNHDEENRRSLLKKYTELINTFKL